MDNRSVTLLLFILLSSLLTVATTSAAGDRFFIVPSLRSSCPGIYTGEPCLTLLQYLSNVHRLYLNTAPSKITLELQPGRHQINHRGLVIENLDTIIIRGNFATIDCFNNEFTIRNVQYTHINGITFLRCRKSVTHADEYMVEDSQYQSLSQLRITTTKATKILRSSFSSGDQTLYVSNSQVEVSQTTFSNNRMGILGHDSNITLHQCTFRFNSLTPTMRYRTSVHFVNNGGAVHLRRNTNYPNTLTLKVFNTEFSGNIVGNRNSDGGAIYTHNVNSIVIEGSSFTNNTAESNGGAIFLGGDLIKEANIHLSSFISNVAEAGGAIYAHHETFRISKSSFVNNTATARAGGVVDSTGHLRIFVEDSFFSHNSAAFCGVFNFDSYRLRSTLVLTQSSFTLNQARGGSDIRSALNLQGRRDNIGGVVCIRNATVSLVNNQFRHNSAAGYGGVLYIDDSRVTIQGSIFDNNTAEFDGGVTYTEFYRVLMKISHSIFSKNQARRGSGGAIYLGRVGSLMNVDRSSFSFNTADDRGGAIAVSGSIVKATQTNFYNNTATLGGIASICNSEVEFPDELMSTNDTNYTFCGLYDGFINHFNTTATSDQLTTTNSPTTETTKIATYYGTTTTNATPSTTASASNDETSSPSTVTVDVTIPEASSTEYDIPLMTSSPLTVYFELNGDVYTNNSVLLLNKVGEGDGSLLCKTNRKKCCGTPPNRYGEFYYPSRDRVPINKYQENFYRNRGDGLIRLNRRYNAVSPTGRFSCVILDAQGILQTLYVYLI